jgi:[ribosomal protein S18]-alanine N-acetyltransferase
MINDWIIQAKNPFPLFCLYSKFIPDMEAIRIREYRYADSEEMVSLHNKSEEFFEDAHVTSEFIQSIAQRDDYRFFVAEKDSKVIGYCGVLFYKNHGRAEIGPILVSFGYRKQDVGSMLLKKTFEFLVGQGIRRVIARVKSKNTEAQKFFARSGFGQEGYFKRYTQMGEDVYQLVRFIDSDI